MIISRTPFRVSFFGGGTDYPVWYNDNKGRVISSAINKYCFITLKELPPFFDYKHRLRYFKREEVSSIEEIQHPSIKECMRHLNVENGIDLVHHADLPAQSGLGSSSTFTVGLLHALYAMIYRMPTKYQLAINAIEIEQDKIGESVGSQDQVAAAFGGFNRIEFGGPRQIEVTPLIIEPSRQKTLQDHFALFFTGLSRNASEIAKKQIEQTSKKSIELNEIYELCITAEEILINAKIDVSEWGGLLNEQWKIKRTLTNSISNDRLDSIYSKGIKAGATGGKLLGAGGGGFMLFFVSPEKKSHLISELKELLYVPFDFDFLGSQIIYHGHSS